MSKKQLHVTDINNELAGASLYFSPSAHPPPRSILAPQTNHAPKAAEIPSSEAIVKVESSKSNSVPSLSPNENDNPPTNEETNERTLERSNQRTKVGEIHTTKQRSNVRTNERLKERRKIRHTFDIFADQLISLREIAIEQEILFGERVLLGDLVQQAIDMLITKQRNQ